MLQCGSDSNAGAHLLLIGVNDSVVCTTHQGTKFRLDFKAAGPGILVDYEMNYRLSCPFMNEAHFAKKLQKNKGIHFNGPELDLGLLIGGKLALMLNHGPCTLVAYGSTSGVALKITDVYATKELPH